MTTLEIHQDWLFAMQSNSSPTVATATRKRSPRRFCFPDYDPSNKAAVQLLSNLEQPDYYNKTVTPDFAEDREEVTKLLHEADGFYQAGRFDLAIKRYEQVLNIDRYNIAARKGMEQVNLAKSSTTASAYNETRSRLLWMVDKSWERPVHRFQSGRTTTAEVQARGRNPRNRSHHGQAQPDHHPANRPARHHRRAKLSSFSSSAAGNSTPRPTIPKEKGA